MERADKLMLVGCFLLIAGTFLPWYSVQFSPQPLPWQAQEFSGSVYGFRLYVGLAILALASINTLITIVHEGKSKDNRIKIGQIFISAIIVFLFIFSVLPPVLVSPHNTYFDPHSGLFFIAAGTILTGAAALSSYQTSDT